MRYGVILFLLIALPCWSQTAQPAQMVQSGKAGTSGFCSPAVSGSNNQFTITCQNIPDKLRVQLVDLLNRVAKNQADAEAILGKLDGCLEGIKQLRENQTPWGLSDDQKKALKARLAGSKAKVSVSMLPSDRNAALFGNDLFAVLKEVGWDISGTTDFTLPPQLVGVVVGVNHADFPEAVLLITTLRDIGIHVEPWLDEKQQRVNDKNLIFVGIGAKPPAIPH
jgi:hypothetical protein